METPLQERKYYPALDGLRGVAIVLVLLSHHFSFIFSSVGPGTYGVDIFFVLSGFLITDILLHTRQRSDYLSSFYRRRMLRIFPIYYLTIGLFYLSFLFFHLPGIDYDYYTRHWPWIWFHLNNLLGIFHPDASSMRMFDHLWSLSVEEQFYLLWPFFILLAGCSRRLPFWIGMLILLVIGGRLALWLAWGEGDGYWYAITGLRFDCLCVGCLLAALRFVRPADFGRIFTRCCIALLATHAMAFLLKITVFPSFPHYLILRPASFSALCGLAILYAIQRKKVPVLQNPVLIFLGKISYGLYIFHFPVRGIYRQYGLPVLTKYVHAPALAELLTGTIGLLTTLLLATVSYYYFERRFLALKEPRTVSGTT